MDASLNLCGSFQQLVTKTAAVTGLEFFRILTEELARALKFNYALVSELTDVRMERARTLAFYKENSHAPNFEYELVGTPCQEVSHGKACFYATDVTSRFPNDRDLIDMGAQAYLGVPLLNSVGKPIGILAALHTGPMIETEEMRTVFAIFAARAGLELERLQVQKMLKASEHRFKGLLESGSDLILALDRDGRIQYASPSCARVTGFEPSEVVGKSAFDFVAAKDKAALLNLFCRALQRPEPGPFFETQIRDKSGKWIDVESRANQVFLDAHNPGLVLNCRDISDRKQAERRLRFKNALLETQSECSPDGILVVSPEGEVLQSNHRFSELWHIHSQDLIGGAAAIWREVQKHITDQARFRFAVDQLRSEPNATSRQTWITRDCRTIEIYSAPVRQSSGVCFGRLWNCRDITEQVRLREQLLHSQRIEMIGEASAGIAHEFKNILVPILGSAELAALELPEEAHAARRWLNQIVKSANTAHELVKQILTFGRQACSARTAVSLPEVVAGALRLLRVALPKSVEIQRAIAADLPMVFADSSQITQVIMNLGINAWQAMDAGVGRITVTVDLLTAADPNVPEAAPGQFVRLAIADTGKGMDAATKARIFEPFFTTKAAGEGTGLGLSVAHGIIKNHNGHIDVTSAPGAGTTFTIYLPTAIVG